MRTKDYIGLSLIALSIISGLYLGFWLCFVGGIMQVFSNLDPLHFVNIGWGIIRFLMASLVGWGSFGILFITGQALLKD